MWELILSHAIDVICTILIAVSTIILRRIEKKKANDADREQAECDGLKALLKYEIRKESEYRQKQKWCSWDSKADVDDMYKPYHALGGNSTATAAKDAIMGLPEIPPEERPSA